MLRYMTFYFTRADSWCNFIRSYKIFSPTSVDAWRNATRSSLALAQTLGATLIDLLLFLHRHLRLQDLLLYLHTCTDAWAWCYVTRSSLVLAQTLDAALQGAGLPGRGDHHPGGSQGVAGVGDHTIRRGVPYRAADRDYIYIYVCMYIYIYIIGLVCNVVMYSNKCIHIYNIYTYICMIYVSPLVSGSNMF